MIYTLIRNPILCFHRAISLSVVKMVYCVVYNCSTCSNVEKNVSFFGFPKDNACKKIWIHYCHRKDFIVTKHSRICGKHFSPNQYSRYPPRLAELGYPNARAQLKEDAVPDIPWTYRSEDATGSSKTSVSYGAYRKRRKIEVLEEMMKDEEEIIDGGNESCNFHDMEDDTSADSSNFESKTADKAVQVLIPDTIPKVKTRTRRIQTGKSFTNFETTDSQVQCDEIGQCCNCHKNLISEEDFESEKSEVFLENQYIDSDNDEDLCSENKDEDPDFSLSDNEESEFEEESDDEETCNYKLETTENPSEEKYYIVSESSLQRLLSVCHICCGQCIPIVEYSKGSMISTVSTCENGHINKWQSQSSHKKLPWFNLHLASAILFSGNIMSKALMLFDQLKVLVPSARSILRLQNCYSVPAAIEVYISQQADLFESLRDKSHVVLGGDGRCDSPGYSAKYCSYSLMDLESNKIIDVQLVQSNEVKGSTHMELLGLKRGLRDLELNNIQVHDLVTDRHVMIKSYMKKDRPEINHYFDVWHIAKGISRKLENAAKKRGAGQIRPWIKGIVNHTYWVAASSGDNGQLKLDKWKSISNHIINVHNHDSEIFPECEHGELEPRDWMRQGSRCYKMVKEVVESPYLLRDLPKLSHIHQTYGLEVFHSVVNHFAPKSTHFFYTPMLARLCVAALHYNENGTRRQSMTKEGKQQWRVCYPKAKKGQECIVKPERVPATFEYIGHLLDKVFLRRQLYPSLKFAYEDFVFGYKADEPQPLTENYEQFDKTELVNKRGSRYSHGIQQ